MSYSKVLTDDQLRILADAIVGTADDVEGLVSRRLDIELDADGVQDVEEALESLGFERCPGCEWWCYAWQLLNDADDVVGCDQCRPAEEEDEEE